MTKNLGQKVAELCKEHIIRTISLCMCKIYSTDSKDEIKALLKKVDELKNLL